MKLSILSVACAATVVFSNPAEKNRNTEMTPVQIMSTEIRTLDAFGIGAFPLEGKVHSILARGKPRGWVESGQDRTFYLDLMEPMVRQAATWIAADGALIDPVIHQEWAQTTPRFVSSAAILLHFKRIDDLQDTVFRAMSYCCAKLSSPNLPKSSSADFWMRELVTAYDCLNGIAPVALVEQWRHDIAAVIPEKAYVFVDPTHQKLKQFHNWAVYSSSGESMRDSAGIGGSTNFLWGNRFFDTYMSEQIHRFTDYGMYRDPDDPITYDITTRLQFAAAIARGYNGPLRGLLEEINRRGNQTMLLYLSPDGFVPYGGRSSQFNFQEAMACVHSELEARRYQNVDPVMAGAFKRQAHLSAQAITPWFRDCNPIRHIKNRFQPETRHGCDTYGQYSVYSMLATSFLGLAALYADDTIAEYPTPSEIGGYTLTLQPAFHKAFLCADNTYVEIDTQADPHHDATGIGRILFKGLPPGFPLGMPFASEPKCLYADGLSAPQKPIALGPVWQSPDGATNSLAAWSTGVDVKTESQASGLKITYRRGDTVVSETIRIASSKVVIDWMVEINDKPVTPLEITLPYLVHDGEVHAQSSLTGNELDITFQGQRVQYCWPSDVQSREDSTDYANRLGVYKTLRLVAKSGRCHLEIKRGETE